MLNEFKRPNVSFFTQLKFLDFSPHFSAFYLVITIESNIHEMKLAHTSWQDGKKIAIMKFRCV